LDLRPAVGLFPIGLGGTARVINDAQYDPDTANKLQRPNQVRGLLANGTSDPPLEDDKTVARESVFPESVYVPIPTSQSLAVVS
jgi:hypothetical protein